MKRVMCGKMTMAYQNVQIGKSPGNVVYRVRPKGGGQQCSDGSPRATNSYMVPTNNVHSQHQSDAAAAAAWNILAVSMYIRSQSPESSSCLPLPPLPPSPPSITTLNSTAPPTTTTTTPTAPLISSSMSSDAVDNLSLSSSCCTSASSSSSSLYSGQSVGGGVPDHETRSSSSLWSSEESGKAGSHLSLKRSGSIQASLGESCCTDSSSSDEEKFSVTCFERQPFHKRQSGGSGGAGAGAGMPGVSAGDRLVESSGAHPDLASESPPMFSFNHKFHSAYARSNGVGGGLEMSSSSSSSIGGYEDSSCSSGEGSNEASGEMEVESPHRGGPLHHMDALEASLPIKRGLSRFWNGKAKSFSSLTDVLSIEQLAKPDNPYARRRRANVSADRHKSFPPRSRLSTAGISKKPTSTSGRNGLAVAVAMGSQLEEAPKHHHHDDRHGNLHDREHHYRSPSAVALSPSSSRSLSLADLVQATSKAA